MHCYLTPDEVLVKYLTEDELALVEQNPMYFLSVDEFRSNTTLFSDMDLTKYKSKKNKSLTVT